MVHGGDPSRSLVRLPLREGRLLVSSASFVQQPENSLQVSARPIEPKSLVGSIPRPRCLLRVSPPYAARIAPFSVLVFELALLPSCFSRLGSHTRWASVPSSHRTPSRHQTKVSLSSRTGILRMSERQRPAASSSNHPPQDPSGPPCTSTGKIRIAFRIPHQPPYCPSKLQQIVLLGRAIVRALPLAGRPPLARTGVRFALHQSSGVQTHFIRFHLEPHGSGQGTRERLFRAPSPIVVSRRPLWGPPEGSRFQE